MRQGQTTRYEVQPVQGCFERGGEAMISVIVPGGQVSIPEAAYLRLDEWARWARDRFGILDPQGRCLSVEGRHISRYEDKEQHVAMPVDAFAALAIEKIVIARTFPRNNHLLLKLHFVTKNRPRHIANACGFHFSHYGDELRRSVLMVRNNLRLN